MKPSLSEWIRRTSEWVQSAWPVSSMVVIWGIYGITYWADRDAPWLFEALAVLAQLVGGGLFALITINNHLLTLERPSLARRAQNWWRLRPWRRVVTGSGSVTLPWLVTVAAGDISAGEKVDGLEARVTRVEVGLQTLRENVSELGKEFQQTKQQTFKRINELQDENRATLRRLHEHGLGWQVFGVLLAAGGTVAGALL